ncbi:response regulator transcription factor [Anaerosporobacter sp.]|uniref:response regulator transcription factor n=1 Tax=Anaerosporobacter sp. TaxID=1872529 RepID=UPI00286F2648|nr:response regulator transcription factor [Anaerosporobacter sp.]
MNIIAVDDEKPALFLTERAIREGVPGCSLACFASAKEALSYAGSTMIDIAFLDIDMRRMDGLTLAKKLQEIRDKTNIIFVTGYSEYAVNAFSIGSSGYIMKPVEPEVIALEVSRLRNPLDIAKLINKIGHFTFDHDARRVFKNDRDLRLQPREYNIFLLLASHPDVYFSPQELYEKTSGQDISDDIRALYVQMHRLRKKLGLEETGIENGIKIEQSRGKGYRLTVK